MVLIAAAAQSMARIAILFVDQPLEDAVFAPLPGWSYDEHHLIDIRRLRLRFTFSEGRVSDVGFDSQKHGQTRHDAEQGGGTPR